MTPMVREMAVSEFGIVIDYFFKSTRKQLEALLERLSGVYTTQRQRIRCYARFCTPRIIRANSIIAWTKIQGGKNGLVFGKADHPMSATVATNT